MAESINYKIVELLKKCILDAEDNTEIAIATAAYNAFTSGLEIEVKIKGKIGVALNV